MHDPAYSHPVTDFQHCQSCATEYVAGVPACADCGGPLSPGPVPDLPPRGAHAPRTTTAPGPTPDIRLVELPGLQADFAVRALTVEGIACGVECQGIRKIHLPESPPHEPLAVTLPVSIYVPSDKLAEAQSILQSLEPDDIIGAQWEADPEGEAADEDSELSSSPSFPDLPTVEASEAHPTPADGAPHGESTTARLLLFLVVAAAALFFLVR